MRVGLTAICAAMAISTATAAQEFPLNGISTGPVYYNLPGADVDRHNTDFRACVIDVAPMDIEPDAPADSIVGRLIWGPTLNGLRAARYESCMVAKGWRVYRLPEVTATRLRAVPDAALPEAMAEYVGTASPEGGLVRQWSNQAARLGQVRFNGRPATPGRDHLAFRLYKVWAEAAAREGPPPMPPMPPVQWLRPHRGAEVPLPQEGRGVIVFRLTGTSFQHRQVNMVMDGAFTRRAEASNRYGFNAIVGGGDRDGWFAFVVPAGRWVVTDISAVNFCLGAPSFEVGSGEVVYAGTFNLTKGPMGPEISPDSARQYLRGPAAERVRAADYVNGSTFSCLTAIITPYAFEIDGAPFAPDYSWGSRAASAEVTPAP